MVATQKKDRLYCLNFCSIATPAWDTCRHSRNEAVPYLPTPPAAKFGWRTVGVTSRLCYSTVMCNAICETQGCRCQWRGQSTWGKCSVLFHVHVRPPNILVISDVHPCDAQHEFNRRSTTPRVLSPDLSCFFPIILDGCVEEKHQLVLSANST